MFKKKLEKNFDKFISFAKLYKYSKILPFKYLIIEPENDINYISFDNDIINKLFKIRYSFPFIEYVINSMIDEYNNDQLISIYNLSGSAFGNALELKIRSYLSNNYNNIEIRKVWTLGNLNENLKKSKLNEIEKSTLNSKRYKEQEDITNVKKLIDSEKCYFYFYPENQDNYLLDSLILIKKGNNNFSIIAFQITKNKKNDEIKAKNEFKNYLVNEVKKKFEKLYDINITQIYLWFILSNENIENIDTCKYLQNKKIKFVFFSIKDKTFFVERDKDKIKDLLFFQNKEALIFPFHEEDDYITNIGFDSIELFEDKLFYLSQEYETINYENIRRDFYKKNCGIKIGLVLKKNILDNLRVIVPYENEFYLLFLFSFPFQEYRKYYKSKDEFVFIEKNGGKIYLSYKKNYFEINLKTCKLKSTSPPKFSLSLESEINYNEEEIELSSIKNLDENEIIYLYKIYYLGNSLISKK